MTTGTRPGVALHHDAPQLVDGGGRLGEGDVAGHDPFHRSVAQAVADGLVEVAPGDDADHPAVLAHADARVAVALGGDQSVGDRGVGVDEAHRPAHDLAGGGSAQVALGKLLEQAVDRWPRGVRPRTTAEAAWAWPPPSMDAKQRPHVHRAGAGAGGDEHPVFHADRLQQHLGVDEFHELVGDHAETVDVRRGRREPPYARRCRARAPGGPASTISMSTSRWSSVRALCR